MQQLFVNSKHLAFPRQHGANNAKRVKFERRRDFYCNLESRQEYLVILSMFMFISIVHALFMHK